MNVALYGMICKSKQQHTMQASMLVMSGTWGTTADVAVILGSNDPQGHLSSARDTQSEGEVVEMHRILLLSTTGRLQHMQARGFD